MEIKERVPIQMEATPYDGILPENEAARIGTYFEF